MPSLSRDMPAEILIVEDEKPIRDMLKLSLEKSGYHIHEAETVAKAVEIMADHSPHIALVDWMLPSGSGLEFVRLLRKNDQYRNLPIIMLTAKTEEQDITAGLDAGADDYITKPFSPKELQSRINALLRRSQDFKTDDTITYGPLTLNPSAHQIKANGNPISLGHTEFKLLAFLMKNPNRVYSRGQLLDHVWGTGTFIEERTVDVHILRLRKSLKPSNADTLLETVRGAGYRLAALPSQ